MGLRKSLLKKESINMAKKDTDDQFETSGAEFENADDGLTIDLSNVEEMSFEPLPKGIYNGIIEECEYQLSKSSGKPMWNVRISVTDEEYENRKLFTFLSFSEKALPGTKTALAKIAPELLSGPFNPKDPDVIAQVVTKPVKVQVSIEKYQDNENNRIKKWLSPEGADGFMG